MIRDRWSEIDITAYLDGKLEPARVKDFETALAQNGVLRQRVDALSKTLTLLRETPLRETPRNYLLTPSMVADPKPARQSSPWTIGFMRLATSLTAAAFVLTLGLNVLNRGLAPAAVMKQEDSLRFIQSDEVIKEDTGDMIIRESEEPVLMIAADTPAAATEPVQEKAFAVEEPAAGLEGEIPVSEGVMELAPESDVEAEDTVGVGGGDEQSEAPLVEGEMKVVPESAVEVDDTGGMEGEGEQPVALEAPESPEMPQEESVSGTAEGDEPERVMVGEAADEMSNLQPVDDAADGELIAAVPPGEVRTEVSPETEQGEGQSRNLFWRMSRVTVSRWVPLSLGITTLLLLGITLFISSRRR